MKCAKCGHEVDPSSPCCPYCASGAPPVDDPGAPRARCPRCGSPDLDAVRKVFDPGCGCLGLLLWGWRGLLLGLLNGGDVEIVCRNCGHRWRPGGGGSCLLSLLAAFATLLMFAAAIWILTGILFGVA